MNTKRTSIGFLVLFVLGTLLISLPKVYAQCPPQISASEDITVPCGVEVDLEVEMEDPESPMTPPGCSSAADMIVNPAGGAYINSVSTSGGVSTDITNMNTLVDGDNPQNAWISHDRWYSDYTNHIVDANPGGTFMLNLQGNKGATGSNPPTFSFRIWIDWDNDGTFNNTDELVHTTAISGSNPFNFNNIPINIPTNQSLGTIRMRVRVKYGAPFVDSDGACTKQNGQGWPGQGNYDFTSEVEDYAVKIVPGGGGGGGTYTYSWSPSEGLDAADVANPTVTPTETTTYTVTVTDTENDCSSSVDVTVTVTGQISVTTTVGDCNNGKYDVTGEITTPQAPDTGDLVIEDCDGNQTIIASAPFNGTTFPFSLTDLDADGETCNMEVYFTAAECAEEIEIDAPEPCEEECVPPTITVEDLAYCDAADIDLNEAVSDNTTQGIITFYASQNDAENAANEISTTPSSAGNYWVRVENPTDEDCYNVYEIEVTIGALTYDSSVEDENCNLEDGEITLSAEGGNAPYAYSIDGGTTEQSNGTFSNLVAGSYNIHISDDSGCEVSGTINVNSIGGAQINDITTENPSCAEICDGEIEITAAGGNAPYTYSWSDNDGNTVGNNSSSISQLCEGTYTVEVEDANHCKVFADITITDPDPSSFDVTGINPSCGNEDGEIIILGLTANSTYNVSYDFNGSLVGPSGKDADNNGNIIINNLSEGNYTNFNLSEMGGCSLLNNSNITLVQPGAPTVIAPADLTICLGESVTLTADNPDNGTLTWDNGITNGVAYTPTVAGVHTYTVTSSIADCSSSDQVTVNVEAAPQPDFIADLLKGCAPLTVNFSNLTLGNSTECVWEFGDGTTALGCGNVTHTYTSSGSFTVSLTVQTSNECEGTETKTNYITVIPSPIASFSINPTKPSVLTPDVDFFNSSKNGIDYQWNFGDGSPLSSDVNPSHSYTDEPGDYIITLVTSNEQNCTDTARLIVTVEDEIIFYVPNSFTPDGDKFNETFHPIFTSGFDPYDYHLMIFDRWGEMIFESKNAMFGWDGTYGGKTVKDGTYVWKIEFKETMSDKRHTHVGHVTLIR